MGPENMNRSETVKGTDKIILDSFLTDNNMNRQSN